MPPATLEWFGTATFRVRDAGLNLFFDAYLDRLPGLEPVLARALAKDPDERYPTAAALVAATREALGR